MNTAQLLTNINPDEIKIYLSNELKQEAWQEAKNINDEVARYRAYLNILARKTFIDWLNLALEKEVKDKWETKDNLSIWQFVNGSVIEIDSTRIVLIPEENEDKSEISIPQEWLNVPEWVSNYYVAVQINVDDNYLCFWGYTSYQEIQSYGELDSLNRSVYLPAEYLETDLSLMILDYEYGWETAPKINTLSVLSTREKETLIKDINHNLCPRLLVNFNKWLSLIRNPQIRYSLYENRQPISLSMWLNNQFQSTLNKGWQTLNNFSQEYLLPNFDLSPEFATRSFSTNQCLEIIQESDNEVLINNAIQTLGTSSIESEFKQKAISLLNNLIQTTDDEEIRWNAALSLRLLSPQNKSAGIWRAKRVNLEDESNNYSLVLVIGILPKSVKETSVFIRVYPCGKNSYLPNNLSLQIIDQEDQVFEEITSGDEDSIIQYKFWGNLGEEFKVKLSLNFSWFIDRFLI